MNELTVGVRIEEKKNVRKKKKLVKSISLKKVKEKKEKEINK